MFQTFHSHHVIYSIKMFLIKKQDVTHSPIARRDTPPTPRPTSSCTITQFTWCWPFRSPHQSPYIHNPLRATVTPVLRVLFRLRIILLTLRLWLWQCPVRDGWVLWIADYGCRDQDTTCVNDVVHLGELWNTSWHIQTQSTADLLTMVVAANTPPRKPDFARLTSRVQPWPHSTLEEQNHASCQCVWTCHDLQVVGHDGMAHCPLSIKWQPQAYTYTP